eukprot:229170_1
MAEMATTEQGQTSLVSGQADYGPINMLSGLDSVLIRQPIRAKELLMEMLCSCEMSNLYTVQSFNEESGTTVPLFDLHEQSNCFLRQCCGAQRPLQLKAVPAGTPEENTETTAPLFLIDKPFRGGCCCCPSTTCMGRNYMEVWLGSAMIGSVREKCLCNCRVSYGIHDPSGNLLYSLERCLCFCECMAVGFEILDANREETGRQITKLYSGILQEAFTTNDNFLCQFPKQDSPLQVKLLMVCAAMMIEFRHFEQKQENNDDGNDAAGIFD